MTSTKPSTRISSAALEIVLTCMEDKGLKRSAAIKKLVEAGLEVPKKFTTTSTTKEKPSTDIKVLFDNNFRGYGQKRLTNFSPTELKAVCKLYGIKPSKKKDAMVDRILAAKVVTNDNQDSDSDSGSDCSDCSGSK